MSGLFTRISRARQDVKPAFLLLILVGVFDALAFALAGVEGLLVGGAILGAALLIGHIRSEVLLSGFVECEIDPALRGELHALLEKRPVHAIQTSCVKESTSPQRHNLLVISYSVTSQRLCGVWGREWGCSKRSIVGVGKAPSTMNSSIGMGCISARSRNSSGPLPWMTC